MKFINGLSIIIILAMLISCSFIAQASTAEGTNVRMGASTINITPLKPAMMSGYDARKTPSIGVKDSIYASAFYFVTDNTESILITADVIGFSFEFTEEMRKKISEKTGIPNQNIWLVAAHNHAGPAIGEFDAVKDYTAELKNNLLRLASNAIQNPVPVKMGVGKGYCALNINRRAVFAKDEIWLGRNSDAPCDHELMVVKFETMDSKPYAVLVNWPCHGTVTGDSNYWISGDWLGSAARNIKAQLGDNVIVGVTAAASGDINSIYGPGNVFKEVEAVGYNVGTEALSVMENMDTYPISTLQTTEKMVTFPGKKVSPNHFAQEFFEPGPDAQVRLSVLKIGNVVLAGISGELFNEIGMEIKKQSPNTNTLVLTHCNGSSGYICTDSAYPKGGYEVKVTKMMPGVEKALVKSCKDLIYSLKN